MTSNLISTRRRFLFSIAITGSSVPAYVGKLIPVSAKTQEDEVSPAEDLMREHGVLRRILLIYREAIRRIDAKYDLPLEPLSQAAEIVRTFVEDYHEKIEEQYLFPRFKKQNTLVSLVDTLDRQHQKGRILTRTVLNLARPESVKNPAELQKLQAALAQFIRMYEPHAAREDTVLFPAFKKIVSAREYDELGDRFEKKEHELFGEDGFEKNVEAVEKLEKELGIFDLNRFTPA